MSLLKNRYVLNRADEGDPMLPFMSLLLLIIPMLLTNVAFYRFKNIELNTPGMSSETPPSEKTDDNKKPEKSYMFQMDIDKTKVEFSLIDEESGDSVEKRDFPSSMGKYEDMKSYLTQMASSKGKLDTILVSVKDDINYEQLVHILNECQKIKKIQKSGEKYDPVIAARGQFNMVLLPRGE